jgi:hypothetical protein
MRVCKVYGEFRDKKRSCRFTKKIFKFKSVDMNFKADTNIINNIQFSGFLSYMDEPFVYIDIERSFDRKIPTKIVKKVKRYIRTEHINSILNESI